MKVSIAARIIAVLGAMVMVAQAATDKQRSIPSTITTEKGVTYQSVELISSNPEGLVVAYKPQDGGVGVRTLRFQELPESLRQEFNYDEGAARDYAQARQQMLTEMHQPPKEGEPRQAAVQPAAEPSQPNGSANPFPVDRFRAAGTIRGAMMVDTITGETWLLDLHTVLKDPVQDRSYFLQPKITLPQETPSAVFIGP